MGDLDSVRVALRIRPLVSSEINRGCQVAVEKVDNFNQVLVNKTESFTFNFVFDWRNSQEELYNSSVSDMLDKCFRGFNATILAYGQTGSGKTHTMGTIFDGCLNEHTGVIPRAVYDIFERTRKMKDDFDFVVKCSFVELYQEQLFDLLSNKSREDSVVEIREDRSGIVMVGLTEKIVFSAKETTDCLISGSSGRAVASTAMNQQSSRSHAIFTITLEATKKDESRAVTTSKFHLVDLAGSERSKKTQATGDRFREGVKINQGLLALGNVISALGDGKGAGFVRYRDSKLTRLLQDSLGGNSMTLMIACVSSADYNVSETLSTLRYADRARKIKNKPIVNQDPHAAEINRLKGIIQRLRLELLAKGGSVGSSLDSELENGTPLPSLMATSMPAELLCSEQNRKYKDLREKYSNLQQQWQMILHDVTEHEMRAHIFEVTHRNIKTKVDEMKHIVNDLKHIRMGNPVDGDQMEKSVLQISALVGDLQEELERTQTEILDNKKRSSLASFENSDLKNEEHAAHLINSSLQEHTELFTNKQMEINEQLRRINRELTVKEQLHQRIAGNFSRYSTLDDNVEEKFKECEKKIQELEAEKCDLLEKLRHVKENVSAKLSEGRRKRLQILEIEITEMKRENMQQAKLLKIREKETQKIQSLNKEIQSMKEAKVKLIRNMRQESEKFRQFKMMREKEVVQLKTRDRKLQNEMARKEALHNKQRKVLKRKCEEALAINKRLKDALDRQKVAQSQRQHFHSAKDCNISSTKVAEIIACVERELEVIVSLIEAERTLEQLKDDRSIINRRLEELQQQQCENEIVTDDEMNNLRGDLEMRDNQIADLQQKVCVNDIDTIIRNLSDAAHSLVEARAVVKHLLKVITEMRRENIQTREDLVMAEEKCMEATKSTEALKLEYEEAIAEYEEKISLALTPEQEQRLKLQEKQERKIETLLMELENYKKILNGTKSIKEESEETKLKHVKVPCKSVERIEEDDLLPLESSDSHSDYDYDKDPDWIKTPKFYRRKRTVSKNLAYDDFALQYQLCKDTFKFQNNSRSYTSQSINNTAKLVDDEDLVHNQHVTAKAHNSRASRTGAKTSDEYNKQRKSTGCSCRGDCRNQRCGCNSSNQSCTLKCRCKNKCLNNKENAFFDTIEDKMINNSSDGESDEDKNIEFAKERNDKMAAAYLTPKMPRISTINFDTSTAKKNFFDNN
uniref:Kinesin motor domain-containing protein n=1 Tax=Glossina pallidipes TaxID=7398 RepID=A0A1A9ZHG6_GLOPL